MKRGFLASAVLGLLCGAGSAATMMEDFASDPLAHGWQAFGNEQLFRWNSAAGSLEVTWDSSSENSYFYQPLGTILGKNDDVQLSFDLRVNEIAVGLDSAKPFTFELAVGLISVRDATGAGFLRGTGSQSPNLLEFDYFPDSGFGATISPVIVSSNNQFIPSFTAPVELAVGDIFHVTMRYTATNQTLATTIERDGHLIGPVKDVILGSGFTDYEVDAVSISSYSDEGAGGSLLAKGVVDNLAVVFPDSPRLELRGAFLDGVMRAAFTGRTNWLFTLERTEDWRTWRPVSAVVAGVGDLTLQDETQAVPGVAFYRVRAERAK